MRHSPGESVEVGELVLVRELEGTLHRDGKHQALAHENGQGRGK